MSDWCLLSLLLFFNGVEIGRGAICSTDKCITVTMGSNNLDADNSGTYYCGSGATLHCSWNSKNVFQTVVRWVRYNGNNVFKFASAPAIAPGTISYPNDTDGGKLTKGSYSCRYDTESGNSNYWINSKLAVNISISIEGSGDTCSINSTKNPYTIGSHFGGMNPLIYTIISGLLLFVLILVSIITCWIRSRKNARLRALLPQDSPQDYLDYIQQGQFTPLTSIEFIASLRERPPTYNESQVIQRRMDEEGPSEAPPPLPPRNPSMRQSPIEGNSPSNTPIPPDAPASTPPPSSPPNLFPTDVTLSFFLDEPNELDQLPPPLLLTPDTEQTDSSTETSNVLVGVIPSINNAMV